VRPRRGMVAVGRMVMRSVLEKRVRVLWGGAGRRARNPFHGGPLGAALGVKR